MLKREDGIIACIGYSLAVGAAANLLYHSIVEFPQFQQYVLLSKGSTAYIRHLNTVIEQMEHCRQYFLHSIVDVLMIAGGSHLYNSRRINNLETKITELSKANEATSESAK